MQYYFEKYLIRLNGRRKILRLRPFKLSEEYPAIFNLLLIDYIFENKGAIILSFDNVIFIDGIFSNNFNNANNSNNKYLGISIRSDKFSIFLFIRIQSYIEEINIEIKFKINIAGKRINNFFDLINLYSNKSDRREIYLFF